MPLPLVPIALGAAEIISAAGLVKDTYDLGKDILDAINGAPADSCLTYLMSGGPSGGSVYDVLMGIHNEVVPARLEMLGGINAAAANAVTILETLGPGIEVAAEKAGQGVELLQGYSAGIGHYPLTLAGLQEFATDRAAGRVEGSGLIVLRTDPGTGETAPALNPELLTIRSPSGDAAFSTLEILIDVMNGMGIFPR